MTKTIYYVAASIDGFIATEDDNLDWLLSFGFEDFQEHYDRFFAGIGALVMGSGTYEFIRREDPDGWAYPGTPAWVLTSRELDRPPGVPEADIRFTAAKVPALLPSLQEAAGGRDVWVVGGGQVAAQFADAGLLDELWLTVMPVALGSGRRLLPVTAVTERMELVSTMPFPSGAIELRYTLKP